MIDINKAAEEGGLPARISQLIFDNTSLGWDKASNLATAVLVFVETDRASRQVANKAEVEPVGEVILFGGDSDLKEVAWRKGKLPDVGTKLYATPPATTGASTVLTDERLKEIWRGLVYDMSVRAKDMPITFARAIEREVAAQAGQVAVPIYQIQYVAEKGSSIWHDATEEAYHTFVLARRRIIYAAPSPAKESK
jgi:hypothetical protein